MTRKIDGDLPKLKSQAATSKLEEIHLFVEKGIAEDFRRIARKTKMSKHALFEDMVNVYFHGDGLKENLDVK